MELNNLIATGKSSKVYQSGDQAIKVFNSDVSKVDVLLEALNTARIEETGLYLPGINQVTMIDAPKVENYEHYCKQLTKLIIYNYIKHCSLKRKYFVKDAMNPKRWKTVEVDFPAIDVDTVFSYELIISTELPKNKSRIEAVANKLMEMQMQLQGNGVPVDVLTPSELSMILDLPIR